MVVAAMEVGIYEQQTIHSERVGNRSTVRAIQLMNIVSKYKLHSLKVGRKFRDEHEFHTKMRGHAYDN